MKTAVEILFDEMNKIRLEDECDNLGAMEFFQLQKQALEKAKELEKYEITRAFYKGMFDPDDENEEEVDSDSANEYYNFRFD